LGVKKIPSLRQKLWAIFCPMMKFSRQQMRAETASLYKVELTLSEYPFKHMS